jgi:hypothetical protein
MVQINRPRKHITLQMEIDKTIYKNKLIKLWEIFFFLFYPRIRQLPVPALFTDLSSFFLGSPMSLLSYILQFIACLGMQVPSSL